MLSNSKTLLEDIEEAKLSGYLEEFMFRNDKLIWSTHNNYLISAGENRAIIIWKTNLNKTS